MILKKNRILYIIFIFFIVFLFFINILSGQKSNPAGLSLFQKEKTESQDSSYGWKRRSVSGDQPDTNFTWEKYATFLTKLSDTSEEHTSELQSRQYLVCRLLLEKTK